MKETSIFYNFLLRCPCANAEGHSENQSIQSHRIKQNQFSPGISLEKAMLYFSAAFFVFVGTFLFSLTLWSFIRKMFVYTFFMEIKLDPTFFALPAGIICYPTVLLTVLLKSNKLNYMLVFVSLQVLAITTLFTGYSIGTVYKLHFSNQTVHLTSIIPREALNNTLANMIANYEESPENNTALDVIQSKFICCGIDSVNDFVVVPKSCYTQANCKSCGVWPNGCLIKIQQDVAWHKHITLSLSQLFILMYFFDAAMVLTVFISDHYKWKSIKK